MCFVKLLCYLKYRKKVSSFAIGPSQAGKLGRHDEEWSDLHEEWIEKKAPVLSIYVKAGK